LCRNRAVSKAAGMGRALVTDSLRTRADRSRWHGHGQVGIIGRECSFQPCPAAPGSPAWGPTAGEAVARRPGRLGGS
jgi:hypothetical protein